MSKKSRFLLDMHYFRAFAILNVILAHILYPPRNVKGSFDAMIFSAVRETVFHNSTIYFIFISGFLFYHLSSSIKIRKYYVNKLKNVVMPYVVISTGVISLRVVLEHVDGDIPFNYAKSILMGSAQPQYWYIPFITLVFIISPLLVKIDSKILTKIGVALMLLPLLGTRTGTTLSVGQYTYFFPIYCFGAICAAHYDHFIKLCQKYRVLNSIVAIATSMVIFQLYAIDIDGKLGFINLKESLFSFKK